ncbi:hypothetical protein DPMN_176407 [Dreissena polymorpha]|uniref:Peptidase S1 domain-containing protein n=1 Tax=Dreissena polymorpha TaxID=45954 RepID=A0A9D4IJL4_DREPO|nr:hypothetical protein DPMN_176407 [Dreissena polymorpha]
MRMEDHLENMLPIQPGALCPIKPCRFKQFGVTSWGLRGSDKNAPAIYVNIIYHQEWVKSITGVPLT